jgi:MutS domain V
LGFDRLDVVPPGACPARQGRWLRSAFLATITASANAKLPQEGDTTNVTARKSGYSRLLDGLIAFAGMFFPALLRRARLRARWTQPGEENGWCAGWYFDLLRERLGAAAVVDDKTWADLEFPRFFTAIDTTISLIGRQYLFAQLRTYEYDQAELDERQNACGVLQSDQALRERIQLALWPLETQPSAFIADLLLGPEPQRVPHGQLVLPWALLSVVTVAAALTHVIPIWLCVVPLVINISIAVRIDAKLGRNVDALLGLARMLGVANRIARARSGASFSLLRRLVAESDKRRKLAAQIKSLATLERARSIELIGGLAVTLNLLFLLKFALYARSIERFARSRAEWLSTFQLVGAMDASIAIASFLCRYPDHCRPGVSPCALVIENGYHPFISKPVKNSIRLEGRSALITGSNMTGKTTFIKMVAINAVLGHTLGICLADQASLPQSPVRALIRGDQSVAEGKSRYFAEAEAIRDFIADSASGACRIFVLDEPFSGTNTVERIAIAKAVLRAIGANAQVLVTTHDVELQHLLGVQFELFYFQENPAVEGFFDHALHSGASTQRNAIRVLERLGYPAEIIAEALATVPKDPPDTARP